MIEQLDTSVEAGWLHDKAPVDAQVVATLAAYTLNEMLKPAEVSSAAGVAD